MSHKTYTIAILGNHNPLNYSMHHLESARVVGSHTARLGAIVATDTHSSFGIWSTLGAREVGGMTIGFSPGSNKYEHENHYRLSTENLSTIVYTGFGYLGSHLVLLRSVDYIIVFLGDEKLGHEAQLAKEIQKPLMVVSFEKTEEETKELLGALYGYAEVYTNQDDLLARIQSFVSHKN